MENKVVWTEEAQERLKSVPFFVRKMAKAKIEKEAIKSGETEITVEFMHKVRSQEH